MQKEELKTALYTIGLRPGDAAFVHSAHDSLAALGMPTMCIIESLLAAVGKRGTLAMPTFPEERLFSFLKEGRDLKEHPIFDCQRTPSYSGLLTEVFRRLPAVERSLHPTHPVAVCGVDAHWITADHHLSSTPFDDMSPFKKLLDRNACILRIGSFKQGAMTFRHLADHMFQQNIPYPIYSRDVAKVQVKDKHGEETAVNTRVLNCDISCNHLDLIDFLINEGSMITTSITGVPLSFMPAEAYINAYQRHYGQGLIRHYPRSNIQSKVVEPGTKSTGVGVERRLKAILVEQANNTLREDEIHDKVALYGKGIAFDSVGIVSLIAKLESEFEVFFESEEIVHSLSTFESLAKVVQTKLDQP